MAYRIPRGHDVNRPPYQELSEGVRPSSTAVPQEAYTGLPPVRIDELAHDPIVLDAGTLVGIAPGGLAAGKLFPAHQIATGTSITLKHHSDGASWGLPTSDVVATSLALTGGPVKPLGMVFQPIYSFMLQATYTNYKRTENVGIVTDYMVQIPAKNAEESAIAIGDLVMAHSSAVQYGQVAAGTASLGSLEAWDGTAGTLPYVVGRCYDKIVFATGTATTVYQTDFDAGSTTLTAAGSAEFKGLDKVQTVPGIGLAGSGTGGVPSWLTKAYSDSSNNYSALTILVRL